MAVRITPVTRDDVRHLFRIEVAPDQSDFVGSNAHSLAQAAYEPGAYPFVIWKDDLRVGLVLVVDLREAPDTEPGDDPTGAYLWRLLVGQDHQRQGHGRGAMLALMDWAKARGNTSMALGVVTENNAAIAFYESLGFVATGRVVEGEVELRRAL